RLPGCAHRGPARAREAAVDGSGAARRGVSGRSLVSNLPPAALAQARPSRVTTLRAPIVQPPLAGGASTPALAAAVAAAGGLGFLAGGYKTAAALGDDIRALRALTSERFGVNVFAPPA